VALKPVLETLGDAWIRQLAAKPLAVAKPLPEYAPGLELQYTSRKFPLPEDAGQWSFQEWFDPATGGVRTYVRRNAPCPLLAWQSNPAEPATKESYCDQRVPFLGIHFGEQTLEIRFWLLHDSCSTVYRSPSADGQHELKATRLPSGFLEPGMVSTRGYVTLCQPVGGGSFIALIRSIPNADETQLFINEAAPVVEVLAQRYLPHSTPSATK
jgi:hypothetical protein